MYLVKFNKGLDDLALTNNSLTGKATVSKHDRSGVSYVNNMCQKMDYQVDDEVVVATYPTPVEWDTSSANNASDGFSECEANYRTFNKRKICGVNVSSSCNAYDSAAPAFNFSSNVFTVFS